MRRRCSCSCCSSMPGSAAPDRRLSRRCAPPSGFRTTSAGIKAAVTAWMGGGAWRGGPERPSEGQQELLEVIDEEPDRLNRFIEGLSAAGTAEASQPFNLRAADLDDIIRAGLTRAETLTRDHRLVVEAEESLPPLA